MDAITLLKDDHKTVEALFAKFEAAGENAIKTKRDLVDKISEALAVHASIEEQVFYPEVRKALPDAENSVLEALEEHHVVKSLLAEIDGLEADDERFDAKVTVLIENVRHHVEEEETGLFPDVRKAMGRDELAEIGEALESAKRTAPTMADPEAPDTPPGDVA